MTGSQAGFERRVQSALEASPSRIPVILGGCGTGRTFLLRDLRDRAGRGASVRRVSRNELIQAIREKQMRSPDQAVVISADKDVRYEAVLEVMDMLQQNQVKKVGLLAKPRTP